MTASTDSNARPVAIDTARPAGGRAARLGVAAAMASSLIGGSAVAATRLVAGSVDPFVIGVFRFGIGASLLVCFALAVRSGRPHRTDLLPMVGLGLLLYLTFPYLFNVALRYTTAAHGALALSTLPLMTMAMAAATGREPLSRHRTAGVVIATGGVAAALMSGPQSMPSEAWQGDLLMLAAGLCMATFNVFAGPVIRRSDPMTFAAVTMVAGALGLTLGAALTGGLASMPTLPATLSTAQWLALAFLGVFGGAIGFFLWSWALANATPTNVAVTVTLNPLAAALLGAALLDEPLRWSLLIGLLAVLGGILMATRPARSGR